MTSLPDALTSAEKKDAVVSDCLQLLEEEVADKGGLSGLAIKAGYKTVKGLKPGFLRKVVADLVPEFARALDPIWKEARDQGEAVPGYFSRSSGRVADALLAITDEKANRSTNGVITGLYGRLRSTAKKNVESAVPRLGRLIDKHAP